MNASAPDRATRVVLRGDTVPLFKILKFEGLTPSGAEAKQWIADGRVQVNGVTETRKRRQTRVGDRITVDQYELLMVSEGCDDQTQAHSAAEPDDGLPG